MFNSSKQILKYRKSPLTGFTGLKGFTSPRIRFFHSNSSQFSYEKNKFNLGPLPDLESERTYHPKPQFPGEINVPSTSFYWHEVTWNPYNVVHGMYADLGEVNDNPYNDQYSYKVCSFFIFFIFINFLQSSLIFFNLINFHQSTSIFINFLQFTSIFINFISFLSFISIRALLKFKCLSN